MYFFSYIYFEWHLICATACAMGPSSAAGLTGFVYAWVPMCAEYLQMHMCVPLCVCVCVCAQGWGACETEALTPSSPLSH